MSSAPIKVHLAIGVGHANYCLARVMRAAHRPLYAWGTREPDVSCFAEPRGRIIDQIVDNDGDTHCLLADLGSKPEEFTASGPFLLEDICPHCLLIHFYMKNNNITSPKTARIMMLKESRK